MYGGRPAVISKTMLRAAVSVLAIISEWQRSAPATVLQFAWLSSQVLAPLAAGQTNALADLEALRAEVLAQRALIQDAREVPHSDLCSG